MKKTFQIIKNISVPYKPSDSSETTSNTVTTTERLKDGYSRVTGVMIVSHAQTNDLAGVHVSLKIAQQEVLPTGFDASLITYSPDVSMAEIILDISKENIPAKSSELELTIERTSYTTERIFDLYLVLEKD